MTNIDFLTLSFTLSLDGFNSSEKNFGNSASCHKISMQKKKTLRRKLLCLNFNDDFRSITFYLTPSPSSFRLSLPSKTVTIDKKKNIKTWKSQKKFPSALDGLFMLTVVVVVCCLLSVVSTIATETNTINFSSFFFALRLKWNRKTIISCFFLCFEIFPSRLSTSRKRGGALRYELEWDCLCR